MHNLKYIFSVVLIVFSNGNCEAVEDLVVAASANVPRTMILREDNAGDEYWRTENGELVRLLLVNDTMANDTGTEIGCVHHPTYPMPPEALQAVTNSVRNFIPLDSLQSRTSLSNQNQDANGPQSPKSWRQPEPAESSSTRSKRSFWPFTSWYGGYYDPYDYPPYPYGPYQQPPPPPPYPYYW